VPVGVERFQRERLLQARKARGLTAISLADLAGLGQATISQYEKGTQKPRQENLDKLANLLNVPPSFFLQPVTIEKRLQPGPEMTHSFGYGQFAFFQFSPGYNEINLTWLTQVT